MLISPSFIRENFSDSQKFDYWISKLPSNYTIEYKGNKLLICGLGVSPDYAFPIINPSSPIPSPKDQGIVYVSNTLFYNLEPSPTDIFSYYAFSTMDNTQNSANKIISTVNSICEQLLGERIDFGLKRIEDATNFGMV